MAVATPLTAQIVKQKAREFGASLVGIASAEAINTFPPDPKWPQIPRRLSGEVKSLIATAVRIPLGEFRGNNQACIRHLNQLVLRRMETVSFKLVEWLERQGHVAFQIAAEETSWELKKGSYGYLSTRHVGVEAGLGTLGLEVNILTPEYGPRVYLTSILTTAELEPDPRITQQLCIGEACGRCLYACPPDAVLQWGLDKRRCATHAQSLGIARLFRFLRDTVDLPTAEEQLGSLTSPLAYEIWQSMIRVVGAFGNCPRCIEVCPVGEDYVKFLSRRHKHIPEKTPEKVQRLKEMQRIRESGEETPGLSSWNLRWVGEDGYQGKYRGSNGEEVALVQGVGESKSRTAEALPEVTAAMVKAKALELGADLVGIASGRMLENHPPNPAIPQTPGRISAEDSQSVIVIAKKLLWGVGRIPRQSQQKLYTAELIQSKLQEICLDLVYWLEDLGYPSMTIPPNHTDYEPGEGLYGPLSLSHVAVEAGLGTLGLNLQLLTPEYGPRVLLAAFVTHAELQPDRPLQRQLCLGPDCGRCLLTCPGDAVGQWSLDKRACSPFSSPFGFAKVRDHITNVVTAESKERQRELVAGRDTFEIWQAMLHGVGAYTGCTRCLEVCPVGADYDVFLREQQEEIPEATPEKQARLEQLRAAEARGDRGPAHIHSRRWIEGVPEP